MSSELTWSGCTPYDVSTGSYDYFHSLYNNIRYQISTSSVYKIKADDVANLPGISFRVYGTVDLWRVILEYNGLNDPINDIEVGMVLNIPSKSEVASLLSSPITNTVARSTITI